VPQVGAPAQPPPSSTLCAPGEEYVCGPDEWERVKSDPELIGQGEPAWLLALIAPIGQKGG
jgi:hypothetical protein